jgi:hypothetical protein
MSEHPDHKARLDAARAWAGYMLGDASWADVVLVAYMDPDAANLKLTEEMTL